VLLIGSSLLFSALHKMRQALISQQTYVFRKNGISLMSLLPHWLLLKALTLPLSVPLGHLLHPLLVTRYLSLKPFWCLLGINPSASQGLQDTAHSCSSTRSSCIILGHSRPLPPPGTPCWRVTSS
jgi:hypothetical protein